MFIDSAKIYLKAGDGGNGSISFHREKYVAKGGPDGGDGGKGGDIIFVVDEGMRTLVDFRYKRKYVAKRGEDGGTSNCTGKSGEDMIIKVPPGTVVKDEKTGRVIADLTKVEQIQVIAKGGKGGAGNQHFATSTRQIPNFAKPGEQGEEKNVLLELKLLADVGLVGYPNVGKSTMLSCVSAATPKIANYHFTTLIPNLGVVDLGDKTSFVIADIPGLIEGAHEGVGLGHKFLKHIERTKIILHIIDISGQEGRDPLEDFEIINKELKEYSSVLAARPQIVVLNKIDLPDSIEHQQRLTEILEEKGYMVFSISAATNLGLKELMDYVAVKLRDIPDTVIYIKEEQEVVYKEENEEDFRIYKDQDVFVVEGKWIRKIVGSTNFNDHESLQYFQRAITKKGVVKELEDMGINEGDLVKMDDFEFEFIR